MTPEIKTKLQTASERHEEIAFLMSDPDVMSNQNKFRDLSKEYASLEDLVKTFAHYIDAEKEIEEAQEMMTDPEFKELARETITEAKENLSQFETQLQVLLIPKDPDDNKDIFLEIRAGTGGDEASIFSGDLFRMYSRYAEGKKWQISIVTVSEGEHGGFKEVIAQIEGDGAYSRFKFESGTHRVQRVPATESQGRVHTSACTVAILPVTDAIQDIDINPADLRIDTFRASGSGGQHVNKTDSAIRLTHLPTGIVVECQDQRSQHKNKARAMKLLQSRITDIEKDKQASEQSEARKLQVGSGDRSQRIRTYNYPQGRITDHRINLTLYKLPEVMEGDLDQVIEPLIQQNQADLLINNE
ncbi:MAG: peptide chain release factor 1 [Alcanivoracaceae bacterium]|nr:peptide chain release factor 1 [Alcanivoracaceae bacterium]